jgi:hypothetical protein
MTPDDEEVARHTYGIRQQIDLRTRLMLPVDRDLRHLVPLPDSQQEHLDIKAEPIHSHPRKQIVCHGRLKELEAALGIFEAFDSQ